MLEVDVEPAPCDMCLVLGQTLWNRPSSLGRNASILSPLLQVPDLDADGAPDLLVLAQEGKEVQLALLPRHCGPHATWPLSPGPLPLPRQNLGLTACQGTHPGLHIPGTYTPSTGVALSLSTASEPLLPKKGSAPHWCLFCVDKRL